MRKHCAATSKRKYLSCVAKTTWVKPLYGLIPACYRRTKNSSFYFIMKHLLPSRATGPSLQAENLLLEWTQNLLFLTLISVDKFHLMAVKDADASLVRWCPLVLHCDCSLVQPRQTSPSQTEKEELFFFSLSLTAHLGWNQANHSLNRSEWLRDSACQVP